MKTTRPNYSAMQHFLHWNDHRILAHVAAIIEKRAECSFHLAQRCTLASIDIRVKIRNAVPQSDVLARCQFPHKPALGPYYAKCRFGFLNSESRQLGYGWSGAKMDR